MNTSCECQSNKNRKASRNPPRDVTLRCSFSAPCESRCNFNAKFARTLKTIHKSFWQFILFSAPEAFSFSRRFFIAFNDFEFCRFAFSKRSFFVCSLMSSTPQWFRRVLSKSFIKAFYNWHRLDIHGSMDWAGFKSRLTLPQKFSMKKVKFLMNFSFDFDNFSESQHKSSKANGKYYCPFNCEF